MAGNFSTKQLLLKTINDDGTSQYWKPWLPNASTTEPGVIKIDDNTIVIDTNGVVSVKDGVYVTDADLTAFKNELDEILTELGG